MKSSTFDSTRGIFPSMIRSRALTSPAATLVRKHKVFLNGQRLGKLRNKFSVVWIHNQAFGEKIRSMCQAQSGVKL